MKDYRLTVSCVASLANLFDRFVSEIDCMFIPKPDLDGLVDLTWERWNRK